MRFGGHETFPIREGWLRKGLVLLQSDPDKVTDEYAADWLGVGRNMAKSIRHWLVATGLATHNDDDSKKSKELCITRLGGLLLEQDPYFVEPGTWWILHINLVNNPKYAASWNWFFNSLSLDRFDRATCMNGLHRYLKTTEARKPSPKTLERDLACLLSTYSRPIPNDYRDPEETYLCPFSQLGIMSYFRASKYYQVHRGEKAIPSQVFCYALSLAFLNSRDGGNVKAYDAIHMPNAPGRVFALNSEALFEMLHRFADGKAENVLKLTGLAGERVISIGRKEPHEWIAEYYQSLKGAPNRHVA